MHKKNVSRPASGILHLITLQYLYISSKKCFHSLFCFIVNVYIFIGKDNKDIDWYVLVHFEIVCADSFLCFYFTIIYTLLSNNIPQRVKTFLKFCAIFQKIQTSTEQPDTHFCSTIPFSRSSPSAFLRPESLSFKVCKLVCCYATIET